MKKILNWGLLSTARINRALIKPMRASKLTRLLAVASRSISSAEAYAREWNIPRAHGSYEALLADPKIDVIYNSLPNHLHAEWSHRAIDAGREDIEAIRAPRGCRWGPGQAAAQRLPGVVGTAQPQPRADVEVAPFEVVDARE